MDIWQILLLLFFWTLKLMSSVYTIILSVIDDAGVSFLTIW